MVLSSERKVEIRFSETDAMGVAWHGNYLKYFEDGREHFGEKYKLSYLQIYNSGYFTPIVKMEVDYKNPLRYGQYARIITELIPTPAAKIIHTYKVYNQQNLLCATGKSVQVFLEVSDNQLSITTPDFYQKWKAKMGIF